MSATSMAKNVLLALWVALVLTRMANAQPSSSTWRQVTSTGSAPRVRDFGFGYSHTSNVLVVFGGRNDAGDNSDETWIFDINSSDWRQVDTSPRPAPRFSMVYGVDSERNRFIVATGEGDGREFFNDIWAFDIVTETWTEIGRGGGMRPSIRYGAAGGVSISNPTHFIVTHGFAGARFDDTFALSFADDMWRDVTPNRDDGDIPFARCLVAGTVTGNSTLVMFGGCGTGGHGPCPARDTWVLNTGGTVETTGAWTQTELCPGARNYPAMAPVSDGSTLLVGGNGHIFGHGEAGDLQVLGSDNEWTLMTGSGDSLPATREGHALVLAYADPQNLDAATDFHFMFGGETSDGITNELWELRPQAGVQLAVIEDCPSFVDLRPLHGVLMFLSWGLLLPIGGTVARFGRHWRNHSPLWFKIHRPMQYIGVILSTAGFIVAIVMIGTAHFLAVPHAHIGVVVVILGLQQPFNACCRPEPPHEKTPRRVFWERWHKNTGRIAMFLGLLNCVQGFFLIGAPIGLTAVYLIWAISLVVFYIVQTIRGEPGKSRDTKPKDASNDGSAVGMSHIE